MKVKTFLDDVLPTLRKGMKNPNDAAEIKTKAVALIGDQPLTDEAGNPVQIDQIILQVAEAEKAAAEDPAAGDPKDPEAMGKAVAGAVAKAMKAFRDEMVAEVRKTKAVNVTGGEFRNDDTRTFGFKGFGEQLRAVAKAAKSGGRDIDPRLLTKAPAGMNVTNDTEGGYLTAPEYSDKIYQIVHAKENWLGEVDSFDIGGPSIKINGFDETSRATGSRRGGVRGYWLAEAGSLTASKPKFRQMTLSPHKLGVLVYTTDELLEDTGSMLESMINQCAGEEIDFMIGQAIFNGDGAGKPLGILNSPCLIPVTKETGQPAATLIPANIVKMWQRLHPSAKANAKWWINSDIIPQLHLLNQPVGTGGGLVYMPPGGLSDKPYATLYGRPIVETEYASTLGTQGDIVVGDPKAYVAVTRGAVKSAMSMHVQFLTDELAFRFLFKIDGQPWWHSALTPLNGSATQSPFVTLETRA